MERFFWVLAGYYQVEFHGKMLHRFMNICRTHQIELWKVHYEYECDEHAKKKSNIKNIYPHFYILQRDFGAACEYAQKCDASLQICSGYGLPEFLRKHRQNIFLATGLLVATGLIYILSCYIWNIEIDGNYYYSQSTLVSFLESEGAGCGSKKSELVPSQIEENLRIRYPRIAWVSARIVGTRLLISVEEATLDTNAIKDTRQKNDITADMAGTVISIVTRRGTPMVHEGEHVEKGDVLIRGSVDIIGDDQTVVDTINTGSDGEVWMQYQVPVQFQINRTQMKKMYTGNTYTVWRLWFGSHVFTLPAKYQDFAASDKIDTWKKYRLTTYFYLPFQIEKNTYKEYELVQSRCSDEALKQQAQQEMSRMIQNIVNAGGHVTKTQTEVQMTDTAYLEKGFMLVEIPAGQLP